MAVSYEIVKHIGVIRETPRGYTKEVNLVSWNGAKPKIDIRDWDADHERMSKGIALTEEDAQKVAELILNYFKEVE